MSPITLRPFAPSDIPACLAIFDSNCPTFVDPSERADFEEWLHRHARADSFLVGELQGEVVVCGGVVLRPERQTAHFAWGLVRRDLHRQGIGRRLTEARLDLARQAEGVAFVDLDTSQHTKGFYEGFGFVTLRTTENAYGPGLHRYDMRLAL